MPKNIFITGMQEQRLVGRGLENMRQWFNDNRDTYITNQKGNPVKMALGAGVGAIATITEALDVAAADLLGNRLELPHGPFGRIKRDTRTFAKNLFTFHWLRAGSDAIRFIGSVPLDIADVSLGFDHGQSTRARVAATLNDQQHVLAA